MYRLLSHELCKYKALIERRYKLKLTISIVPNAVEHVWKCTQSNTVTWLAHTSSDVTNYKRGSILKAASTFLASACFKNCRHTGGEFCHLSGGITDDTRVPTALCGLCTTDSLAFLVVMEAVPFQRLEKGKVCTKDQTGSSQC
jgi:hypothetical protein